MQKNYSDINKNLGLRAPFDQFNNIVDHTLEIFEIEFKKV